MKFGDITKIKSLETTAGFRDNLQRLGIDMPCDDTVASGPDSPLAAPLTVGSLTKFTVGNRFAIQPMEGWDGTVDGQASDNTIRRWRHFGLSGAKLIWGGEAVAVRHDGRANPNQLVMSAANQASIAALRDTLVAAHREAMGDDAGLFIGLAAHAFGTVLQTHRPHALRASHPVPAPDPRSQVPHWSRPPAHDRRRHPRADR